MAARDGMANLITRLRSMTNAGTADYILAGGTFWTDNQLQDRLDEFRADIVNRSLVSRPEFSPSGSHGSYLYLDYPIYYGDLEEAASGTAAWNVQDNTGASIGTANYSVDYIRGMIRFAADQVGSIRFLRARSYNLAKSAAAVWREKASYVSPFYSFSAEGQTFTRDQWFAHCMEMAEKFDGEAGVIASSFVRTDLNDANYR